MTTSANIDIGGLYKAPFPTPHTKIAGILIAKVKGMLINSLKPKITPTRAIPTSNTINAVFNAGFLSILLLKYIQKCSKLAH